MTEFTKLPQGRYLPETPSIEALKKEAKAIHKAHKTGAESVFPVLRHLAKYKDKSDQQILTEAISLVEAQFALAIDYGFSDWKHLINHIASTNPRTVEKVTNGYRYSYQLEKLKDPNQRFFSYSDLTFKEHWVHLFHNELTALQLLADSSLAPNIIDADPERFTLLVEDIGTSDQHFSASQTEAYFAALADLHTFPTLKNCRLKRNWPSVVNQCRYFGFSPQKMDILMKTPLSEVLSAIPMLLALSKKFSDRYTHGKLQIKDMIIQRNRVRFADFALAHTRYQMADVADICAILAFHKEDPTFDDWMSWWNTYAHFRSDSTDDDLCEFLYITIRRCCRRLSKRKPIPSQAWGEWLIQCARAALRELNTLM